ncbi:helix-turn-helix domain-containing protein [Paenibacillus abyssi]|uniref:AraC family transcriptional regulator n=1 Tax=Paenibacillus abyssi TaxID=1340531 RepID=A0A917CXD6_9BACL|nr:AraC family transcriptional regulator [Paenibacillus abyssi]GGG00054.1 AraC family transcriptional regulator [Paenibacillus abyssi]
MTYPKELREETRLSEKAYPFQFFRNRIPDARRDKNILYLHWHEHFEMIVMERGSAVFHIDSRPYEARHGEFLIVPSGGLHVGYSLADEPVEFVSLVFNPSLFSGWMQDSIHTQYVTPYMEGRLQFPVKPDALDPTYEACYTLLKQMISEYERNGPAYLLVVKSLLYALVTQLSRTYLPLNMDEHHTVEKNRERFKSLIRYIETHPADKITLEQAAKRVNLNPYHFCKTFKRLTGRTFVDYVNLSRINEAERLLIERKYSVTEIASMIGCGNPNYFTKLFKQYKGITPSQFIKKTSVPFE